MPLEQDDHPNRDGIGRLSASGLSGGFIWNVWVRNVGGGPRKTPPGKLPPLKGGSKDRLPGPGGLSLTTVKETG